MNNSDPTQHITGILALSPVGRDLENGSFPKNLSGTTSAEVRTNQLAIYGRLAQETSKKNLAEREERIKPTTQNYVQRIKNKYVF